MSFEWQHRLRAIWCPHLPTSIIWNVCKCMTVFLCICITKYCGIFYIQERQAFTSAKLLEYQSKCNTCIRRENCVNRCTWFLFLFSKFSLLLEEEEGKCEVHLLRTPLISTVGFFPYWCWSWNSNTLASWCEELTHWERPWCWERLRAGGKGDGRGWDGWMASPIQWTRVWVNSRSWWWTGRPDMLRFMGSQRVGHDWATELNWTEPPVLQLSGHHGVS